MALFDGLIGQAFNKLRQSFGGPHTQGEVSDTAMADALYEQLKGDERYAPSEGKFKTTYSRGVYGSNPWDDDPQQQRYLDEEGNYLLPGSFISPTGENIWNQHDIYGNQQTYGEQYDVGDIVSFNTPNHDKEFYQNKLIEDSFVPAALGTDTVSDRYQGNFPDTPNNQVLTGRGPDVYHKSQPPEAPESFFAGKNIDFLTSQLDRMNIPMEERGDYMKNIYDWSQQVRNIESDNNPMAAAGSTSAKGVYQFTDDSVTTGLNRMRNMGFDEDFIQNISSNPHDWTDEQADAMFLANTFAQRGSDDMLNLIGGGDTKARQDAYYKFHHTAPDEATINRVNKLMPHANQAVDDTMDSYNKVENAFNY